MTLTDLAHATLAGRSPAWAGPLPSGDPTGVPAGLGPGLTHHLQQHPVERWCPAAWGSSRGTS